MPPLSSGAWRGCGRCPRSFGPRHRGGALPQSSRPRPGWLGSRGATLRLLTQRSRVTSRSDGSGRENGSAPRQETAPRAPSGADGDPCVAVGPGRGGAWLSGVGRDQSASCRRRAERPGRERGQRRQSVVDDDVDAPGSVVGLVHTARSVSLTISSMAVVTAPELMTSANSSRRSGSFGVAASPVTGGYRRRSGPCRHPGACSSTRQGYASGSDLDLLTLVTKRPHEVRPRRVTRVG